MSVSVLIAEDHDLTRQGIRSLLRTHFEAQVLAATGDGLEAFPLIEKHRPDLLILDLGLPHLNGLNVLRKTQKRLPSVEVVVLSMYGDDTYVRKAFELGASGYVLKGAPLDELTTAIRAALEGDRYLSSGLSEDLVESAQCPDPATEDRYEQLTEREREVLRLTAEGYTSREIGDRLYISPRTVEKHRENVQDKLGLRNVVEMAAYAHQRGLTNEPPPSESNLQGRTNGTEAPQ